MYKLETLNELTLKATCDGSGVLFTKAGAFIGGECYGQKNYSFDKVLLGPQGSPVAAIAGQIARRFTGENLPLMKITSRGQNITYYANAAQHVTVMNLQQGQTLMVESENILAFTENVRYSVKFIASGVISQKGLATSTLTGMGPGAQVAILTDGNPIVLSNMQNGAELTADPDAAVCWTSEPQIGFDLSFKMLLGSKGRSGESYFFKWNRPTVVIIQPNERQSGIDIGMDGQGGKPQMQDNNLFRQDGNQMFNNMNMGNNNGGFGGNNQQGGLGGLGSILGGIIS